MKVLQVHHVPSKYKNQINYDHVTDIDVTGIKKSEVMRYAYAATQGNWSFGKTLPDGEENPHYDSRIKVVLPLESVDGRECGHRSSMVGDALVFENQIFRVEPFGFSLLFDMR